MLNASISARRFAKVELADHIDINADVLGRDGELIKAERGNPDGGQHPDFAAKEINRA